MNKTPISTALERQIPEHIREEYATFVQFVKAYYEFLEQTQQRNLEEYRSLDTTLDEFVIKFKKELSLLFPTSSLEDERFILKRIREFYKTRGSQESFKFLFRAFFNKEAEIYFPSKQILRASAGQWIQEKSIFIQAIDGKSAFDLSGKIFKIQTSRKSIDVYSPRVREYRYGIYEVFIDRAYVNDISIGDTISYDAQQYGTILPCPSKYTIIRNGSGFSVGGIYNLPSSNGAGSIIKITKVSNTGGIEKVQVISFGLDYKTTFFAKLSNSYHQPIPYYHPVSSATIGAGHPSGLYPTQSFSNSDYYGDTTTGYMDYGYVIRNDYFAYQADYVGADSTIDLNPYFGDGTYVGDIIGEFYTNALNGIKIDETLAEIQIDLGSVAIYPGYYNSTDGFISDEIYIQDGKYYQLFSYVIKVEEQLDSYVDLIKSLLHPAGFELFAQYNIKNDFIVSTVPLDAFVRYQFFDRVYVVDLENDTQTKNWLGPKSMNLAKQDFTAPTIDSVSPEGYPREIKRYSVLLSVAGDGTVTVGAATGVTGYLSEYANPAQINRNEAQSSTLKNNWDIVLGNQNSDLGTVAPLINSTYTAIGNFESRILGSADTLGISRSGIADSTGTTLDIRTQSDVTQGKSDSVTQSEAYVGGALGSVAGLEWDFKGDAWIDITGVTTDTRSSATNPTVISKGTAESPITEAQPTAEVLTRDVTKFKQPQLLGFTATITAGQKTIAFTAGYPVNTMISLKVTKISGAGAFGTNATIDSIDLVNRQITVDVAHVTSGAITFSVEQSSNEAEIPDLAGTVTIAETFKSATNPIAYTKGVSDASIPAETITKLEFAKFKQPQLLGFTATITAGQKTVSLTTGYVYNTIIGLKAVKVSGTGAFDTTAVIDSVNTSSFRDFTVDVPHTTSGTITFYIEASSSDAEITDLAGTVTPAHSGLTWEFKEGSSAFVKSVTVSESLSRDVTYDRTSPVLEATSVITSHSGLNWEFKEGSSAFSKEVNYFSSSDVVNLKEVSNASSADSVLSSHGGMNWSFSGDTFKESNEVVSIGSNLNIGIGSHDFTFTAVAANLWLTAAANNTGTTAAEQLFITILNYVEVTNTTVASAYPWSTAGYKYGDLDESGGTINSADTLIILKFVNGAAITANQTLKIQKLLGKIAQFPWSTVSSLLQGGIIASTAKIDFVKGPVDPINTSSSGAVYANNPYNIDSDGTVYGYNVVGSDYFTSDTRIFT